MKPGGDRAVWIELSKDYGMPVADLKKSISYRHFRELVAYRQHNVAPNRRLEYYMAQIAQMLFNIHRDRDKTTAATIQDFTICFDTPDEPEKMPSVEETEALLKSIFPGG